MRRENTSTTNATYAKPAQVATYVMSATQSWFGRVAANSRCTRSGGRIAFRSATVVTLNARSATCAAKAQAAHQPLDGAPRDVDLLATELVPDLVRAVDRVVVIPHALDLRAQLLVALLARRALLPFLVADLVARHAAELSLADGIAVVRASDTAERNVAIVRAAIAARNFHCARACSRVVSTNVRPARPDGRSPATDGARPSAFHT